MNRNRTITSKTPVDPSAGRLRELEKKVKRPISTPNLHRHKTPTIKLETDVQQLETRWQCQRSGESSQRHRGRTLEPEFPLSGLYSIDEILQMEQTQAQALLSRQIVKMRSEADLSLARDSR